MILTRKDSSTPGRISLCQEDEVYTRIMQFVPRRCLLQTRKEYNLSLKIVRSLYFLFIFYFFMGRKYSCLSILSIWFQEPATGEKRT